MEIKATNFIVELGDVLGDRLILRNGEARHLTGVMRGGKGDLFYAVDGQGKRYCSLITVVQREEVYADIVSITRNENEPLMEITLGIPMLKGSAMDYALEKATECGVDGFVPYTSANTMIPASDDESFDRKRRRWNNLIRSAVKQSLRSRIPKIEDVSSFSELLKTSDKYPRKIIADSGSGGNSLFDFKFPDSDAQILLLVGPESGFTAEELDDAVNAGFSRIRFGSRRLRAETAAAIFPMILQYATGELT